MKHVKATGLSSVFQGLDPVVFTEDAINKGVTNNSIIYIKCIEGDDDKYGEQFVPGSTWIWAQGEWFAKDTRSITEEEIAEIVFGGGAFPDIPNFEGCNIEIDSALSLTSSNPIANKAVTNKFYTLEFALKGDIEKKADQSDVDGKVVMLEEAIKSKASESALSNLSAYVGNDISAIRQKLDKIEQLAYAAL